jgi:hypothetical protein
VLALGLLACAHGRIVDNTFVSDEYRFSVELPKAPFEVISPKDALVATSDPAGGVTIAVIAEPDGHAGDDGKQPPLKFLARELFMGMEKVEYLTSEAATIDDVPAWYVKLKGVSDGVPLIFSAYVVRTSDTIYDIVSWCRVEDFDRMSPVFSDVVKSFHFTKEPAK